jgi:peptidylprolyl isomerase domain and WD repeat-containing protein 1
MVNTSGENGESSDEPQFKKPRLPIKSEVAHDGKAGVLKYEDVYLRAIPSASQYEKSFMHRQTITHVIATVTNFILTASVDGHLKFWKKKHAEGVEFVKHFKCMFNCL